MIDGVWGYVTIDNVIKIHSKNKVDKNTKQCHATAERPPRFSFQIVFWCWKIRRSRKSIFLDKLFAWLHWGKEENFIFHDFMLKHRQRKEDERKDIEGKRIHVTKLVAFIVMCMQSVYREKMMMPQILCENFRAKFLFPVSLCVPTYFCSFHWLHLTRHDTSS